MLVPRLRIHPPPQTHAATGKYTIVAHRPANSIHDPNFARSAIAPEMRAVVMIAKVAPKAVPMRASLSPEIAFRPKSSSGLPANAHTSPTDDMLAPYRIHSTATSPRAPKLIIIMLTTLLAMS